MYAWHYYLGPDEECTNGDDMIVPKNNGDKLECEDRGHGDDWWISVRLAVDESIEINNFMYGSPRKFSVTAAEGGATDALSGGVIQPKVSVSLEDYPKDLQYNGSLTNAFYPKSLIYGNESGNISSIVSEKEKHDHDWGIRLKLSSFDALKNNYKKSINNYFNKPIVLDTNLVQKLSLLTTILCKFFI